jgi:hypothetical protein
MLEYAAVTSSGLCLHVILIAMKKFSEHYCKRKHNHSEPIGFGILTVSVAKPGT